MCSLAGAHAGEVGGDGVGSVPVKVGLCHVAAHVGARVGVAHGVLHVADADAATNPVVQKVRRRPCGLIGWAMPAAPATLVSARLASARPIRRPVRVRRIGPVVRPSTASRTACSTGMGSGMSTGLAPLPTTCSQLVAGLVPQNRRCRYRRPRTPAGQASRAGRPGRGRSGRRWGGGEHGGELQWVRHGALLYLPRDLRQGHRGCRFSRVDPVDDGELVERRDGAEPAGHCGGGVAASFDVPHAHLQLTPSDPQ